MKTINKLHEYAIYLFCFSLNFETLNLFNLGIDYLSTKITISILLFLSLINFRTYFSLQHFSKYIFPIIAYFVILSIVSYINCNSSNSTFFDFLFFLNILSFLILINHSKLKPDILLKGLFVFSIGALILSVQYFLGFGVKEISDGRFSTFGLNSNLYGLQLCISLVILFSIIFENGLKIGKYRYLLIFSLPILFIVLIQTGSRVSLLSVIIGFFIFSFSNKSIKFSKKIFLLLGSILACFILYQVYLKDSYVLERLFDVVNNADLAHRDEIWILLLDIFSDKLVFGVGKTGYTLLAGEISPHNVFIEVLLYTGIVGLIVFLIFFIRIVINAFRRRKQTGELLPLALIIPISGIMLSGQMFDKKFIWMVFAYLVGTSTSTLKSNK